MADVNRDISIMDDGAAVGLIGAAAVALFFLILDTIHGIPLRTPSVLGQVIVLGDSTPVIDRVQFGAVILYTAFHFLLFFAFGCALVGLVRWGSRQAVVRYALLQLFIVFEVFFYGIVLLLSEDTRRLFPLGIVLAANTIAAVAMGIYLWRTNPEFRAVCRTTPLGAAPVR